MLSIAEFPYLDSAALFDRIAGFDWSLFFDSGNMGNRAPRAQTERFDVLMCEPRASLVTQGETTQILHKEGTSESNKDPLELLREWVERELGAQLPSSDSYLPGAYGYFSYDLARRFESLPEIAVDEQGLPSMAVGIYDVVVVIDHQNKKTQLISIANDSGEQNHDLVARWQKEIGLCVVEGESLAVSESELKLKSKASHTRQGAMPMQASGLQQGFSRSEYHAKFNRVREYVVEGDCYQINLTQQFSCEVLGDAWTSYQQLRSSSPAPYGAYMQLPFAQILSNSPESFIRCRDRQVVTSPIKGTRARDHSDPESDHEIAQDLVNSDKDRAENLMIVDLMRNDLSRCCEHGSVKVPSLFKLHAFANVHHLISTITGTLRRDLHAVDLLRRCFPGGSITGAPKIRAMQIIEELEPVRRGLYCGSVGYLGADGSLETNIAIRTMVVKDGVARFSAGGGLVIDSKEQEEYQELLDKASMLRKVLFPDLSS